MYRSSAPMSRGLRYRVLRKIAHGGMAEIFLALQLGAEGFEKPVVLKRILPALASDPGFVRMLVDEAHIVSRLNHTHLVQILDLGKADDQFFLVLEFVDGFSLEQVRRRARKARLKLPLPLTLYITSALCRGLEYVHRHARDGQPLGIVHRDVTPQNVLLSREGDVKLADFGIAKAIGRREKSATGVIKGKFAYMSPEQTIGAELDARSDLFSVGTLLYVLTTGKKPFDAPTDLDVLMQVRRARHEKPSALVKDFNPEVERFIERALRADRARRYQSAEQMADRLDSILLKLGQPFGPATLKKWLDVLATRDGIMPPGDVREEAEGRETGTIQLTGGDLELQHVWSPPRPDEDDDERLPTKHVAARARAANLRSQAEPRAATPAAALIAPPPPPEASIRTVLHTNVVAAAARAESASALSTVDSTRGPSADELEADEREAGEKEAEADLAAVALAEARLGQADLVEAEEPEPDEPDSEPPLFENEDDEPLGGPDRTQTVELSDTSEVRTAPGVDATASVLLLANPKPARARPTRWLGRLAVLTLLAPLLLFGGAYAAHDYLPGWLVPPTLVQLVDGWLVRLSENLQRDGDV
jgi:eukaryotic-like serine/threonine-protein kinase